MHINILHTELFNTCNRVLYRHLVTKKLELFVSVSVAIKPVKYVTVYTTYVDYHCDVIIIASAAKGTPSYSGRTECQAEQNSNYRNNLMMHWKTREIQIFILLCNTPSFQREDISQALKNDNIPYVLC